MNHLTYTQESGYEQAMRSTISQFWQNRESGKHISFDGTRLYWCKFTNPQHNKALLILNGRIETVSKYQELFYDLFQQGYDLYSYDHRGQGLSDRAIAESDIGHVAEFNDYIDDVQHMVNFFSLHQYKENFLLSHSMGGAIGLRYLQRYVTHPFKAFATSAPMLGLPVPNHLKPIAIPYTRWLTITHSTPTYAPGYGSYEAKPFEGNPFSHSQVRYQWFREWYETHPQLKIGGPSASWVWQSLISVKKIYHDANKVTIPLLLLQAGSDQIVDNRAQIKFMTRLQKENQEAKLITIEQANHELLFEADQYRNSVLDEIVQFYERYSSL